MRPTGPRFASYTVATTPGSLGVFPRHGIERTICGSGRGYTRADGLKRAREDSNLRPAVSTTRGFPRDRTISSPAARWPVGCQAAPMGSTPMRCGYRRGGSPAGLYTFRRLGGWLTRPSAARLGITRGSLGSCGLPRVHPVRLPLFPSGAPLRVIKKETAALSCWYGSCDVVRLLWADQTPAAGPGPLQGCRVASGDAGSEYTDAERAAVACERRCVRERRALRSNDGFLSQRVIPTPSAACVPDLAQTPYAMDRYRCDRRRPRRPHGDADADAGLDRDGADRGRLGGTASAVRAACPWTANSWSATCRCV